MAKQSGTDLDDMNTGGGKKARIDDKITLFKFPPKKWVTLRLFGSLFTYGGYWVNTKTKDGKKSRFYTPAPSYDPASQTRDSTIYDPWRDLEEKQGDLERDAKTLNFAKTGFMNAILRVAQRDKPAKVAKHTAEERKTGFKEKDSDSWTPIVPVRLPFGAVAKLKEQAGLNVVEIKGQTKSFPVTHERYGCDVRIMYNPDKAPADQYQISIGERKRLTEDELVLLKWDLSDLESAPPEAEVKRDFESWAKRNGVALATSKKKKPVDDEEDEDFPDDDGEDDDDVPAKGKKKAPAKGKKKPIDEEDEDDESDDDEEDEDFDDDEEDEPPRKSKSKPSAKGKKKPVDEDDDFDDEDEADEDEDEEDDSDDSDDEDEDDEDEDDEPPAKKKVASKTKAKPAAKGKKKSVDDDEDEDDDFGDDDEEDDEEDEPPRKSKKAAPAKKAPAKKKKPSDDEEDDDLEEEDEDSDDDSEDDDFDDEDEADEDDEPPAKKKKVVKKSAPVKKKVRR